MKRSGGGEKRKNPFEKISVTQLGVAKKEEEEEKIHVPIESSIPRPPQEPEEELKSQPTPPLRADSSTFYFLLRLSSFFFVLIFGLGFYGILSVSLTHDVSLVDASLHLLHLKTIPPRRIIGKVYPLITNPRDSFQSYALHFNQMLARPLLNSLEPSFEYHLKTGTQFACLCMHHLNIQTDKQYRVCATRQHLLMVNPEIVGHSKEKNGEGFYQQIFLEWDAPPRGERLWAKLTGEEARCLQEGMMEMGMEME